MDTTISAYHSAGINLLPGGVGVNDAACSGGLRGGQEHPIVLLDALHDDVPQRSRLCIAVPVRDTYPSGCDGSRTREAHRFLRPCLLT